MSLLKLLALPGTQPPLLPLPQRRSYPSYEAQLKCHHLHEASSGSCAGEDCRHQHRSAIPLSTCHVSVQQVDMEHLLCTRHCVGPRPQRSPRRTRSLLPTQLGGCQFLEFRVGTLEATPTWKASQMEQRGHTERPHDESHGTTYCRRTSGEAGCVPLLGKTPVG